MIHTTTTARSKASRKKRFKYYKGPPPKPSDNYMTWFDFADSDFNDRLTQEEVISAMCSSVRATTDQRIYLRNKIQGAWGKFDKNHDMMISKTEFTNPKTGMFLFLIDLEKECTTLPKRPPEASKTAVNRPKPQGNPPPISKGRDWFDHYDTSHNNALSKEEIIHGVIESLKVSSPIEQDVLRDTIDNSWYVFDSDNSGEIDKLEFLCTGGLQDYLYMLEQEWLKRPDERSTYNFLNLYVKGGSRHYYLPSPSIASDPEKWFNYVDFDHSNKLSQKEVINGLMATLNANSSEKRRKVREFIVGIWETYDLNHDNLISKEELLAENGFSESLIKFEQEWKENNTSSPEEGGATIKIRVNIPKSSGAGDIMQVSSPKSQELLIIQIPSKILWNGGGEEPYYFIVAF